MNNQNDLIINSLKNIESYIKSVVEGKLDKEHVVIWGNIKIEEIKGVVKVLNEKK